MPFRIEARHVVPLVAAVFLGACEVEKMPKLTERVGKGNLTWLTDFEQGLVRAREEGKPMLVEFTGSDWCVWCQRLDREVFIQPGFKEYAENRFVLVELDFPHAEPLPDEVFKQRDELRQKFKVEEYPTVIVLSSASQEMGRLSYMEGGIGSFVGSVEKLIKH